MGKTGLSIFYKEVRNINLIIYEDSNSIFYFGIRGCLGGLPTFNRNCNFIDINDALRDKRLEKLSDYATSLSYIVLETNDNVLIDEKSVCYLGFVGENILVADSEICHLFDSNGRFIKNIGRQGQGPGEYTSIRRVVVSSQTQHIYISHNGLGILEYDTNGNYLQTILHESHLGAWAFMGENIISDLPNYRGDNPYMFAVLNQSGDTIAKIPNNDFFKLSGRPLMFANEPFYFYKGQMNYYRLFNDTVYNIQQETGKLLPIFRFQSTSHSVSKDLRSDAAKFATSDHDYIIPWSIIETENHLFINALRNQIGLINFLYDKQKKSFYQLASSAESQHGISNDIDEGLPFFPDYKLNHHLVCMMIPAYDILEHIKYNPAFSNILFSNLTEESNPVIVILHLK